MLFLAFLSSEVCTHMRGAVELPTAAAGAPVVFKKITSFTAPNTMPPTSPTRHTPPTTAIRTMPYTGNACVVVDKTVVVLCPSCWLPLLSLPAPPLPPFCCCGVLLVFGYHVMVVVAVES